jgi:PAS domain S-box-containing protein
MKLKLRTVHYLGSSAAVIAVYFAAAELGLSLASVHTNVSPVWPPSGIAIAALLIFGVRMWPAVFLGAFAANIWTDVSLSTAAGIAVGNTLEAVGAFWLLNKKQPFGKSLASLNNVLRFVVCVGLIGPAIAATIGNISLCLGNAALWSKFPNLWFTWWLGDGCGALVLAPFVLAWAGKDTRGLNTRLWESGLLIVLLLITSMIVLGGWFPGAEKNYPLAHLCIPFLLWAALRLDQRALTSATLILAGVAVWGTSRGYGPFVKDSPNGSLLLLQVFIASSTLTALVLSAAINERRKAEREKQKLANEIKLQRRRIEDIVAHTPGVVWEAWGEPDGANQRINFVSHHVEKMLGYSEAEWLSTPNFWLSIVHPEDQERAAREAVQKFTSREGGSSRFRWMAKDGREIWVEAQSVVVCDDDGAPIGMRGITIDITAAVKAEQERGESLRREHEARIQAEEASRLRDEFLATVSHELRTPLNAVVGWSRLLRSGQLDQEGKNHALEVIERNAWAQKQIIEDLLDVSRIISGKLNLSFVPVDLVLVVRSAIDVVRPAAAAKQIRLDLKSDAAEVTVKGDSDRLQQVAWNLLANAVKFTPSGGAVEVIIGREQTHALLNVQDTGPGIPPEFMARVFERFSQADSSSTRRHGGLGLGLAIVRHLVEIHGGTVEVHNRYHGSGAVFTVSLPTYDGIGGEFHLPILDQEVMTDASIAD